MVSVDALIVNLIGSKKKTNLFSNNGKETRINAQKIDQSEVLSIYSSLPDIASVEGSTKSFTGSYWEICSYFE